MWDRARARILRTDPLRKKTWRQTYGMGATFMARSTATAQGVSSSDVADSSASGMATAATSPVYRNFVTASLPTCSH